MLLAALLAVATADRPLGALAMMPPPHPAAPPAAAAAKPGKPAREQVLAAVRAEWARYDIQHLGRLGPLEFSTWVMRANGVAVAPPGRGPGGGLKPVQAMNATSRAFAIADANHDGGVTPDEMAVFLMR